MKNFLTILLSVLLFQPAFAADPSCAAAAADKKLAGAAKNSFVKKCVRDACDAEAAAKKLAGAAKTSFARKCVADNLQPYCEEQATGKKLAGAARTSFVNKCQTGE